MSEYYVGEIRMFAGNYAPENWALCNGQTVTVSGNEVLFSLIGTTYGGDGHTTFGLPDLRGRVPIHNSTKYPLGQKGGAESVTLTQAQLPTHTHTVAAVKDSGDQSSPTNNVWAGTTDLLNYSDVSGLTPVAMNTSAVTATGGNQPHNNVMPSMPISFIIALNGLYPFEG